MYIYGVFVAAGHMTQPRTVTPLLLSNHETRVWQVMHQLTGWIIHVMTVQTSPRTHSREEKTLQSGGPRRVRRRAQCLVTGRVHGTPPVSGSLTGPSTDHPLRDPPPPSVRFRFAGIRRSSPHRERPPGGRPLPRPVARELAALARESVTGGQCPAHRYTRRLATPPRPAPMRVASQSAERTPTRC